jgi:nucleoside-diphosphate-sugar epimerase
MFRRESESVANKERMGNTSYNPINNKKIALVLGAGGFIGSHMVKRLKKEGFWVRGVDLKYPEFAATEADDFIIGDLRDPTFVHHIMTLTTEWKAKIWDEVYQFAADMGGAGFVFTGENDADIMHNSALVNLNIAYEAATQENTSVIFYSSSACMYPEHNQLDPDNPNCIENSAYPAAPDSEYGWEKLFSERLFFAFLKNYKLNIRVARYHNIFGPEGTWDGGREKAPAAMCRKAATTEEGGSIEVWGPGSQTRSFLYIDECIEATIRFVRGRFIGPVNIGSEEMISINDFAKMAIKVSGKEMGIYNIDGDDFIKKYGHKCPVGVNGRNSNNNLYFEKMGWEVSAPLIHGMQKTYDWINEQIALQKI